MKLTFKSLLITTVLTFPSSFGAACAGGDPYEVAGGAPSQSQTTVRPVSVETVDDLWEAARVLRELGDTEETIAFYDKIAQHPSVVIYDLSTLAKRIGGKTEFIDALQRFAQRPDVGLDNLLMLARLLSARNTKDECKLVCQKIIADSRATVQDLFDV